MLSKKVMNDIEEYLYIYPNFEQKIEDIKRESEIVIKRDVNSWIKSSWLKLNAGKTKATLVRKGECFEESAKALSPPSTH